jgi:hypothetical protein
LSLPRWGPASVIVRPSCSTTTTRVRSSRRSSKHWYNVAQIEKRDDLLVSTLASYLHAVGGEVRIVVQFPGGHAIEVELDALTDANSERELAASP